MVEATVANRMNSIGKEGKAIKMLENWSCSGSLSQGSESRKRGVAHVVSLRVGWVHGRREFPSPEERSGVNVIGPRAKPLRLFSSETLRRYPRESESHVQEDCAP